MKREEIPKNEVIGESPNSEEYIVFSGESKVLELTWYENSHNFRIYLEKIDDNDRVPGETTALFKQALEKIQEKANELNLPVTLILDPIVPKTKAWAETKAAEAVGGWDSIEHHGTFFTKKIYPKIAAAA